MVAVLNGNTAWVYSSQSGTATEYSLPALPAGSSLGDSSSTTATLSGGTAATGLAGTVDLPAKIQEMVDKLAPYATLTVTTGTVAGRESYTLVMTPTATNTLIGSVQAAFDGTTLLPLRVQVFATGDAEPVLAAGFTKVSYDEVSADTFDFTPPADATVEHTTLSMPPGVLDRMMSTGGAYDSDDSAAGKSGGDASLTLEQAAAAAGFALAVPADPALPFKGAHVMTPPSGEGTSGSAGDGLGGMFSDAGAPLVVLGYGEGFGSVLVMETKVTDAQWAQLTTALAQVPAFGTPSPLGGHQVYQLSTRLGSIVAWRQGDVVVLVGGSVSRADLEAFVAGIHE
jgi:outer membrane lipoprotein-sorting protein